jgi:glycosyltransferase involved in cell wall biosynthesis
MKINSVIIAKNNEKTIEHCINSIVKFVSDVIVVDTGSQDNTIDILKKMNIKLYHYSWNDNFADARNYSLSHSDADWNVVIDSDEFIKEGYDFLSDLRLKNLNNIYLVRQENHVSIENNIIVSYNWLPRILPNGIKYVGAIHEQPDSKLNFIKSPIILKHEGYLEFGKEKMKRNEIILLNELKLNPNNLYYHYQLGRAYEAQENYTASLESYQLCLKKAKKNIPWRHSLIIHLIFVLKKMKQFNLIEKIYYVEKKYRNYSPDFNFAIGDAFLDYAIHDNSRAYELLPIIEKSWLKCLEIGDQSDLDGSVIGRGSFLAAQNLHAYYSSLGQYNKAEYYLNLSRE